MKEICRLSGAELNLLAVAVANALAEDMDAEELGVYAGLFTLMGDSLALLAITQPAKASACKEDDG